MGSEEQRKTASQRKRLQKVGIFILATGLSILYVKKINSMDEWEWEWESTQALRKSTGTNNASSGPIRVRLPPQSSNAAIPSFDLFSFEHCSDTVIRSNDKPTWTTKPLWVPMYPSTLSEDLHKNLINPLTQTKAGGKSFYVSIKNSLRHCIGKTETVTCTNVHPSVEMSKGQPDSLSSKFNSKYILAIRNPMTALPFSHNAKSIQYHGTKGQVTENEWRQTRKEWFEGMWKGWKLAINTWDATKYDLGMILIYEDLMSPTKGPELMIKLRNLLAKEGFNVVDKEDDVKCIWYNAIGKESLERYHKHKYDYEGYIPGFTDDNKEFFLKELDTMITESEGNEALVEVLKRYRTEIDMNIRIDNVESAE